MTIRYINPANDGGFDVNGLSTVKIQVPAGQYWLPRLIKVGLLGYPGQLAIRPFEPRLYTKLYHGTPNDVGPGAFVDATINTFGGDVTAVLNGTMLQPGEWLTAITTTLNLDVWTQGLVYLEVDGLTTGDISEAAQLVVNSVPGNAFRGQLAYPNAMPPMADRSLISTFFNPGLNNTVNLIANPASSTPSPQNLFIYNASILAFGTAAGTDGNLQPIPPTSPPGVLVDGFLYYFPNTANLDTDFEQNFHGMQMMPGGLQWFQRGSAAANTVGFGVGVTYRFMPI
jgi:hypothetical protein